MRRYTIYKWTNGTVLCASFTETFSCLWLQKELKEITGPPLALDSWSAVPLFPNFKKQTACVCAHKDACVCRIPEWRKLCFTALPKAKFVTGSEQQLQVLESPQCTCTCTGDLLKTSFNALWFSMHSVQWNFTASCGEGTWCEVFEK